MRTGLIIAGMHRSGTSAMTRVCNILGAKLGDHILTTDMFNPTGHWEHAESMAMNRRILRTLGGSAGWVKPIFPHRISPQVHREIMERIIDVVRTDFSGTDFWCVKDPEISRLYPFWISALEQARISPKILLMVRNPEEVAASLRRRNGFAVNKSLLLWLRYNLEAFSATQSHPRAIVFHDRLMTDWRGTIAAVQDGCGIVFPDLNATNSQTVDLFLKSDLWHHKAVGEPGDSGALLDMARCVYRAILSTDAASRENVLADAAAKLAATDRSLGSLRNPPLASELAREIGRIYTVEKLKFILRPARRMVQGSAALAALMFG